LGVTDVDAISVAMTRMTGADAGSIGARAIAVAVASNTLTKAVIAGVVGRGAFRRRAVVALSLMFVVLAAMLVLLP
jgi:uncharacterized membrane protein (DUF4010 family)